MQCVHLKNSSCMYAQYVYVRTYAVVINAHIVDMRGIFRLLSTPSLTMNAHMCSLSCLLLF